MSAIPKSDVPSAITIPFYGETLYGDLHQCANAYGTVLFIHGSGSGRLSPRNRDVASRLYASGFNTLLMDLLTDEEAELDERTKEFRFDIALLGGRSAAIARWILQAPTLKDLPIGLFGASTGAAAALIAAAEMPEIRAVVSRTGRLDLAGESLHHVHAPTLLIVGGNDHPVLELNRQAMGHLRCVKRLDVIPSAPHLSEEPGALPEVANLASDWFSTYLAPEKKNELQPLGEAQVPA